MGAQRDSLYAPGQLVENKKPRFKLSYEFPLVGLLDQDKSEMTGYMHFAEKLIFGKLFWKLSKQRRTGRRSDMLYYVCLKSISNVNVAIRSSWWRVLFRRLTIETWSMVNKNSEIKYACLSCRFRIIEIPRYCIVPSKSRQDAKSLFGGWWESTWFLYFFAIMSEIDGYPFGKDSFIHKTCCNRRPSLIRYWADIKVGMMQQRTNKESLTGLEWYMR